MSAESNYIGRQIGNYSLFAEVNSGTYGSVYQAQHIVFDDEPVVALKLLHTHLTSPQERQQFLQEAKLLRKLKHPHILPILDAGIHQKIPYLVTEYASGGSLRDCIIAQAGRPFRLEEALTWLHQIGQALHFVHQHTIVHRDLKPENILFNTHGEALLADFGIAVIMGTTSTRPIGIGGTFSYMAPEQFKGYVSTKSDQYALACIAYELLTGRKPFVVPDEAMGYQHARVQPSAPSQLNPALPLACEQAVLKALSKQRNQRYVLV